MNDSLTNSSTRMAEEIADRFLVVYHDVRVRARNREIRMTRCRADFRQRSAACQGMADESMPSVVNGQRP